MNPLQTELSEDTLVRQLRMHGFYVSTTSGFSMWPMLKDRRDRVVIRAVREDETLRPGDVPLYVRPTDGKYILHRVLRVRDTEYIIRGDNTYQKEIVPKECVVGVLQEFYRKGRHISADHPCYRAYAHVWQGIYPIRYFLHSVRLLLIRGKRVLCRLNPFKK